MTENSSGSPRVHSNGLDSSGAWADVGPCAVILLAHQQEWRKKHTAKSCFHVFSLLLFHYEALLGAAAIRILFCDFEDEHPGLLGPPNEPHLRADALAQDLHCPVVHAPRQLCPCTSRVLEVPGLAVEV